MSDLIDVVVAQPGGEISDRVCGSQADAQFLEYVPHIHPHTVTPLREQVDEIGRVYPRLGKAGGQHSFSRRRGEEFANITTVAGVGSGDPYRSRRRFGPSRRTAGPVGRDHVHPAGQQ